MNKAQLIQDLRNNVYTNKQKLIKGNTVRDRLENIVNNVILYEDDILTGKYSKNLFVTVSQLSSLVSSECLIPQAFYIITDSEYGSLIRTQANSADTLYPLAFDIDTGSSGTYNQSTDTFSPWAQSGVYYMGDVTTNNGNSIDYSEPLIYHKIGNVVNISGRFGLTTNVNQSEIIYFDLPFVRDQISAFPKFAVSANNPSTRYSKLTELTVGTGPTGNLRLTVNTDAADSTNYLIYFSGHYVCV
jgi:hypothetical protein